MLTEYIKGAMRKTKYEILPDDNSFYDEIHRIEDKEEFGFIGCGFF